MKIKINYECDMLKNNKDGWIKKLKRIENKQGYLNVIQINIFNYKELDTGMEFSLLKDWCIEIE